MLLPYAKNIFLHVICGLFGKTRANKILTGTEVGWALSTNTTQLYNHETYSSGWLTINNNYFFKHNLIFLPWRFDLYQRSSSDSTKFHVEAVIRST